MRILSSALIMTLLFIAKINSKSIVFASLSDRAKVLQTNVTAQINYLNKTLDAAFISLEEFKDEIKEVISITLNHKVTEIREYMDKHQVYYFALAYRFEVSALHCLTVSSLEYTILTDLCANLILNLDDHGKSMEDVLKRRGCSEEQIKKYLDTYFERMIYWFNFELKNLDRLTASGGAVGSGSFFVQKNVISVLYDCYNGDDLDCYENVCDFTQ